MKKLMILMAAVATSVLAFGEEAANSLKRVFDASTAADLAGWSIPNGEEKATLTNGVLTLATGSEAATWLAQPDSTSPYVMGDGMNYYFDVSLNMLGQALDEVPTLPDDAKLALFLLDTTDMDGAPEGTNLYALAKHPTDRTKILVKLMADVDTLTKASGTTRLTVQTYKNVFKSGGGVANSAFVVYQNGGTVSGTVSPVQIERYYTVKDDGTVNWSSWTDAEDYLGDVLDPTVSAKRKCLLLSMEAGVEGQSFMGLGFAGNAKVAKVEINDSGFDFIAPDVTTTTMTLTGVTVTVNPADAYDATTGALSAGCTITVKLNEGLEVLKYTPAEYLKKTGELTTGELTFEYTYAEGNDVFFTAEAACAKVDGTAYATLNEALQALEKGGTLKLSRDINAQDLPDGFLTLSGNVVLDLAGKTISAPASSEWLGTVTCSDGTLTITNSSDTVSGRIESTGEGGFAVCSAGNSTISIQAGTFVGGISDWILNPPDAEEGDAEEGTPSITITGGKFSVDPTTWVAEGYTATRGDGEAYWTVAKSDKPAGPTINPITPSASSTNSYESAEAATNAAEVINGNLDTYIQAPEAVTDEAAKKAYAALFVATVVDGTKVVVDLTATAKADIQTQIDAEIKKVDIAAVAAATGVTEQTIETKPGLYYSVIAGDTLTGMTVKSSTPATGATLSISLPKFTGAGFYQIQATVAPLPVAE